MAENKAVNTKKTDMSEDQKIAHERQRNAEGGFFLKAAVWLLSRFWLTKNHYQNWTKGRRILVGWLLWIILLPIIPLVAIIIWYIHDPEGFKKSPWAKGLIALFVVWLGFFGIVATSPAQLDQNGKYSPVQTSANGEKSGIETTANTPSEESKTKVVNQTESKASGGRQFENCTEAFDAGVFNIKRSDKSYQSKLDRDNDGIACEK